MLTVVNSHLVRAIHEKRLIEFVYKTGRRRIVEPHDYGLKRGVAYLFGYQIAGESRSAAPRGWRRFDVAWIHELRVQERHFPGTRAESDQHHQEWDLLFARVT